ncbi:hypothetical protein [Roseateles hydrophilus]|nr:hypothetical protein [Pelomonas sp. UHG3]
MAQMMVGQVDLLTGEMLDGAALAVIYPKRKNGFSSTGWVAVSQNPMLELARADLGGEASRVLFFVLAKLDFENWINLNQTDAAQEMGLQRQNFVRGLRKLIELGVVLPGPKVGRNATYRLNPSFGWKGSAKGHNEALAERMKARGMSVVKSDHEAREELEAAGQMRLDSPPVQ